MNQSICFDWISPKAEVRCLCHEDQLVYLSIRDIITHLCVKGGGDALKLWYKIEKTGGEAYKGIVGYYQFQGMGQRGQPVILWNKACVLIGVLPIKNPTWAKRALDKINASFSSPLSLVPVPPMDDNASAHKKRRVEDLELEERALAIEEKRITMQLEAQAAPLEFFRTCNEIAQSLGGWDPKEKAMNKAMLGNLLETVYRSQPGAKEVVLALGEGEPTTSISKVVAKMGLKSKVSYLRVGQLASNLFLAKHGVRPGEKYGKHAQMIDGKMTSVNDYGVEDEDLIREAVEMAVEEAKAKET